VFICVCKTQLHRKFNRYLRKQLIFALWPGRTSTTPRGRKPTQSHIANPDAEHDKAGRVGQRVRARLTPAGAAALGTVGEAA